MISKQYYNYRALLASVIVLVLSAAAFSIGEYTIFWVDPAKGIDTTKNIRIDYYVSDTFNLESVTVLFGTQTGGGVPANYPNVATQVFSFDTGSGVLPRPDRVGFGPWLNATTHQPLDSAAINPFIRTLADDSGKKSTLDTMFVRPYKDSATPLVRSIFISPRYQKGKGGIKTMTVGKYYFVIMNRSRTRVSREMQLIVETTQPAKILSPTSDITQFRPTFEWEPVPGVPYYHLLLSDQEIKISKNFDTVSNASFIWQAITPGNSIQYGEKDPSGLFPAPPPLAPGVKYEWMILNNYGNAKEYTSVNAQPLPGFFTIKGTLGDLKAPDTSTMKTVGKLANKDVGLKSFYQDSTLKSVDTFTVGTLDTGLITLSWGKCTDPTFNIYKVYLYNEVKDSSTGINAAVAVWTKNTIDTFVTINAKSFLADGVLHVWKVFVENKSGSGLASRKQAFFYRDTTPSCRLVYYSKEKIGNNIVTLKFANVSILPLQGGGLPVDVPTDQNGFGKKSVQLGKYRILINPPGYDSQSVEVSVTESHPSDTQTFVLEKFPAQLYGVVADNGASVSDAKITAVSANGDTVIQKTDALGSFSINVPVGDWTVYAEKSGYRRSEGTIASVQPQESKNLDTLKISRYTNIISGTIKDSASNQLVIGANVQLTRNGVFIGERNTADNGVFSFAVEPGTGYALRVAREGFSTENIGNITLTTNVVYDVVLKSGLGQISGITYVTSGFLDGGTNSFVTNSRQGIVVTAVSLTGDTVASAVSGRGDNSFMVSLPAGTYNLHFSGSNVVPQVVSALVVSARGSIDTSVHLVEYASIKGNVIAQKSGVNSVVNITARCVGKPDVFASTIEATGNFTLTGLDTGTYYLTYARQGFSTKTDTAQIVRVPVGNGIMGLASMQVDAASLIPGSLTLGFGIKLLDALLVSDSTQKVNVKSPIIKTIRSTTVLDSMGLGGYVFGTNVTPDSIFKVPGLKVLDVDSMFVDASRDSTIIFSHPIQHQIADTSNDSVILSLVVNASGRNANHVVSSMVYFRDQSENDFRSDSGFRKIGDSTTIYFRIKPTADNSNMKYYFTIRMLTASGQVVKYSNMAKLYSTFIRPSAGLKYFTLLPMSRGFANPALVPLGDTAIFQPICQDGAFQTKSPDSVQWTYTERPGIIQFLTVSGKLKAMITRDSSMVNGIYVDTVGCRIFHGSKDTLITGYLRILKQAVDTVMIVGDGQNKIYGGGKASFIVVGLNRTTNQTFSTLGAWSCEPNSLSDSIGWNGEFRAPVGRIGTVVIRVSAFGKSASQEMQVAYKIKSDTIQSFDNSFRAYFSQTVFNGNPQDFYLNVLPVSTLPVLKSVRSEGVVVSSVAMVSFGNESQALPSDSMNLFLKIPENYRSQNVFVGVWNQGDTRWERINTVSLLDTGYQVISETGFNKPAFAKTSASGSSDLPQWVLVRVLKLGVTSGNGRSGEYALLVGNKEFGIYNLKIGPNPFSPFVNAKDDQGVTWTGLRIEFDVASSLSASVLSEVSILNLEGNIIRGGNSHSPLPTKTLVGAEFKTLYSLTTSGGFVGNQTLRRSYVWDGKNNAGRLCRNGRYLIKILVHDGVKTTYKTIPVVLFK